MNIAQNLIRTAQRFPDRPAVSSGTANVFSYRTLMRRASGVAAWLQRTAAAKRGDRVAIVMANRPEYIELLFGVWLAGLCAVPINARLHPREIAYILENSGAVACFLAPETRDSVGSISSGVRSLVQLLDVADSAYRELLLADPSSPAEVVITDPAWIFYTSGTTGRPKGATLTHRNLWAMAIAHWADIDGMMSAAAMVHAAPLSHGCGLWSIAAVGRGANNIVLEGASYDPEEVCRLIRVWPRISMYHAPTMLKRLINCPAISSTDLSNLETLIYGGSHVYVADLIRALDILGPKLVQIYGQGESPNTITVLGKTEHGDRDGLRWKDRLASAGIARSAVEFRVLDEQDRPAAPGELGEVVVRGDVVMAGYWNDPEGSERALRGGWLHTGDIGAVDDEGFLTLKDRSKDMIISGGSNIYPREVEEVLLHHPDVLEASVIGRPHADWGEEVVAFVVARPRRRLAASELDRLCLDEIARYKRPRAYFIVEELPKSGYGKILKSELRKMIASGDATPATLRETGA